MLWGTIFGEHMVHVQIEEQHGCFESREDKMVRHVWQSRARHAAVSHFPKRLAPRLLLSSSESCGSRTCIGVGARPGGGAAAESSSILSRRWPHACGEVSAVGAIRQTLIPSFVRVKEGEDLRELRDITRGRTWGTGVKCRTFPLAYLIMPYSAPCTRLTLR